MAKKHSESTFSMLQNTNPEFVKKIMRRSNSNSMRGDNDSDYFRRPGAVPFRWESQPGMPKQQPPSTTARALTCSLGDYFDDDDDDDDRESKEENGLSSSSVGDQCCSTSSSSSSLSRDSTSNDHSSSPSSNNNLAIMKTSSKFQTMAWGCVRGLL